MDNDTAVQDYAKAVIEQAMRRLKPVLADYDQPTQAKVEEERKSLTLRATALDHAINALSRRCDSATSLGPLVFEMKRMRTRGLQFFLFLYLSRQMLKMVDLRFTGMVQTMRSFQAVRSLEMEMLVSEIHSRTFELDEHIRTTDKLPVKRPGPFFRPVKELHLFVQTVLLPFKSKKWQRDAERVTLNYAKPVRDMIRSATKGIYRQQVASLAAVLWQVVQPTIIPSIAGFVFVYFIHALLEVAGIRVLHLNVLVLCAFLLAYVFDRVFEHLFEEWLLHRYRKKCLGAALALCLAEIRARASFMGLVTMCSAVRNADKA